MQCDFKMNDLHPLQSIVYIHSCRHAEDVNDSFLIISFIEETRFLGINIEDELDEIDLPALDSSKNVRTC
jgi:hypothetical protein